MSTANWKVPFRQVYTNSFREWVKWSIWCHFVIRVFPGARDLKSDALQDYYRENPAEMYNQYRYVWGHGEDTRPDAVA